jgi:hypothetical protein
MARTLFSVRVCIAFESQRRQEHDLSADGTARISCARHQLSVITTQTKTQPTAQLEFVEDRHNANCSLYWHSLYGVVNRLHPPQLPMKYCVANIQATFWYPSTCKYSCAWHNHSVREQMFDGISSPQIAAQGAGYVVLRYTKWLLQILPGSWHRKRGVVECRWSPRGGTSDGGSGHHP